MRWATRELIHFDRVVSAWLILRFVDPQAQFIFLAVCETADEGDILFGIPGTRLGAHDRNASTFQRILEAYSLVDPALTRMGRVVADVVDHVMHDPDSSGLAQREPYVAGVLAVAEGIMLSSASDADCLLQSLGVYDALYTRLQAQIIIENIAPEGTATVLDRTQQLSNAIGALRGRGSAFSRDAFSSALRESSPP